MLVLMSLLLLEGVKTKDKRRMLCHMQFAPV
jgi:hypothetical protein